jgi:glucosylceramidase
MEATLFLTTFDGERATARRESIAFRSDEGGQELGLVNLYPEMRYQEIFSFGGAITDAVGAILERLPTERAQEIIDAYFGPEGIGYRAIRTHIDSCDFSTDQYSAVTDRSDMELRTFSLERDERRIIPWIKAACRAAGRDLPVMLSPWSPPAFMKTNGSRNGGGRLKKECYPLWARYLCRYVKEYRVRGVNVTSLSVQNEPNAAQTWDSCLYTPEEEREFLADHLYPRLRKDGLEDVEVYVWDHNKERLFDRACAEIDCRTDHMIAGLAFHWYSGDHFDALRLVREKFPDKKLIFSEGCIEYSRFDKNQLANAQMYAHDILGNLCAGMNGFLDWNIALNEAGGPNHVGNYCEAPVICDSAAGTTEYRLSFRYISHFSRFIQPGARRVATTNFSDRLEVAAFQNPDGTLAVIFLNRTHDKFSVALRLDGRILPVELKESSIATVIIQT